MPTFVTNKEPFLISLKVTRTLCCTRKYFGCVDFTATSCLNGTWKVEITDTDVLDFIATDEVQIRYIVISKEQLDSAAEINYTPPTP